MGTTHHLVDASAKLKKHLHLPLVALGSLDVLLHFSLPGYVTSLIKQLVLFNMVSDFARVGQEGVSYADV